MGYGREQGGFKSYPCPLMHTHTLPVPGLGDVKIHHNGDWSGDAIVMWLSPAGPILAPDGQHYAEATLPAIIIRPLVEIHMKTLPGLDPALDPFNLYPALLDLALAGAVHKEYDEAEFLYWAGQLAKAALGRVMKLLKGRKVIIQFVEDEP